MKQKNNKIENSLQEAFQNATPDLIDSILSDCENEKGRIITMTNEKRFSKFTKWAVATAACLAIIVGCFAGYIAFRSAPEPAATPDKGSSTPDKAVAATVMLDVNPSIDILIDEDEKVLQVVPLNEDAERVIGNMKFQNLDLEQTVNMLIDSMIQNGYIDELKNAILLSIYSNDTIKADAIREKLSVKLQEQLGIDSVIISQTASSQDKELRELSQKHHISFGKGKLINTILTLHPDLSFADLADVPVSDLCVLFYDKNIDAGLDIKGSLKQIISPHSAVQTALDHYSLTVDNNLTMIMVSFKIIQNYETLQKQMVYEVIFKEEFPTEDRHMTCRIHPITKEVLREFTFENTTPKHSHYSAIAENAIDFWEVIKIARNQIDISSNEINDYSIHYSDKDSPFARYPEDTWCISFHMDHCICNFYIDADTGKIMSITTIDRHTGETIHQSFS